MELKEIRKQKELTMPSGAKVIIWTDDDYGTTSELEEVIMKNVKIDSKGNVVNSDFKIDLSNPEVQKFLKKQLINRIVDWDYTWDGKKLEINEENLKKLPAKDVRFLREEINKTGEIPKNG